MTLDLTGYQAPRLPEIVASIRDNLASTLPDLDTSPDSLIGNLIAVYAASLADLSEATQAIYDARTLDGAKGVPLDDLVASVYGITRKPATPQRVSAILTGTPSTVVPSGTLFATGDGVQFSLPDDAEIEAGGTVEAEVVAVVPGPSAIDPADLDQIVTPVTGLSSVLGDSTVSLGRGSEPDSLLRARALASRVGQGRATVPAIRAALLAIDGVTSATVRTNRTAEEVDGLPPQSYQAIIAPQTSESAVLEAIVTALYETAPAGIASVGAQSGTVTQVDNANLQDVFRWDWATTLDVAVEVEVSSDQVPGEQIDALREQIAGYINGLGVGGVARVFRIQCFAASLPGAENVTVTLYEGETVTGGVPLAGDYDPGSFGVLQINPAVADAIVIEVL